MSEPRAYTDEEVRQQFLEQVYEIKEFWEKESVSNDTIKGRLEGCVFSILALLDGSNIGFPAVSLIAMPHPDDEEFHKSKGENWIAEGTLIGGDVELHNEWHRVKAEKNMNV
jgi:hypothetical protein